MAYTSVWSEVFPPDTQLANVLGSDIRALETAIRERLHTILGTGANAATFASDPVVATKLSFLGAVNVDIIPGTGTLAIKDPTNAFNQYVFGSTGNFLINVGFLQFTAAASKIVPGATSLALRNNADSANNILITDAGLVTLRSNLVFSAAAAKVIPGITSISFRNNADGADNLIILDAGTVTIRAGLTITAGGIVVTAGNIVATASIVNAQAFQIGGAAALGNFLRGDGTSFVSAGLSVSDFPSIPRVRAYKSANQDIAVGGFVVVSFDSEEYDTAAFHDPAVNNSRLTFATAGVYQVTAQVMAQGTANDLQCAIRKNGVATDLQRGDAHTTNTSHEGITIIYTALFAATDYVELFINVLVAVNPDILGGQAFTSFSAIKLSP